MIKCLQAAEKKLNKLTVQFIICLTVRIKPLSEDESKVYPIKVFFVNSFYLILDGSLRFFFSFLWLRLQDIKILGQD